MLDKILKDGWKINSTALSLKDMLELFNANGDIKAFSKLLCSKNNDKRDFEDFYTYIQANKLGNIETVIKQIIEGKENYKKQKKDESQIQAAKMDEGTILRKDVEYADYELFKTTPSLNPNEMDFVFFENFRLTADGYIYRDENNKIHRLFTTQKGCLDLKGDLLGSDNSLFISMKKDIGTKYEVNCRLANVAWNAMDETSRLEDVFDKGFEKDGDKYIVPTIMRHFIMPQAEYRKTYGEKGKSWYAFNGYRAFAKNNKAMPFIDQIDILADNWTKLTKGLIKESHEWRQFSNTDEWALNKFPLPKNWKTAEIPESWAKFFNGKASERLLHRVYFFIGACMDASNFAQQCLLISDEGGTGKGETVRLLQDIFGPDIMGSFTNESLMNSRFSVSSHKLYKHHILCNTEYDGKAMNTELFKQMTGGDTISCEIKNGDSFNWNTEGLKLILTTNRKCALSEPAIQRRVIPCVFKKNFDIVKGFPVQERIKMMEDKDKFLAFCFRQYMESPFRTGDGRFIVMNPEQEKEFLETGKMPGEYNKTFMLKAFSADRELGDRFRCGDISEETHLNDEYEGIYDALFEFSDDENDFIPVVEFKDAIIEYIFKNSDRRIYSEYHDTFDIDCEVEYNSKEPKRWSFKSMKCKKNADFISFLEKTKGHVYNDTKRYHNEPTKVVTNIKFKEAEVVDYDKIPRMVKKMAFNAN